MGMLDGVRSFFGGSTRSVVAASSRAFRMPSRSAGGSGFIWDTSGGHSLMPAYPDIGPLDAIRELRVQQRISRALTKRDPWIGRLVDKIPEIQVGTGPEPVSRFPELDDLWEASSAQFDNRGKGGFGRWLRMDVKRNRMIDGEVFIRRRTRFIRDNRGRLVPDPKFLVPIQFQALTSDFVPLESYPDQGVLAGITFDREMPTSYRFHTEHPRGTAIGSLRTVDIPADEVFHSFNPDTGAPRGEVVLAKAFLTAIKLSTLDDAESRRSLVNTLASMIIEPSIDAASADDSFIQDEETINRMIDQMDLAPGGIVLIPQGYKADWKQPTGQSSDFKTLYRMALMRVAAAAGLPLHELTGDIEGMTERMAKYLGLETKRQAEIVRADDEFQILNPMRRAWIDAAMAAKAWTPPPNARPEQIYECGWSWPVIHQANLVQELNSLASLTEQGHIPHGHIGREYFGIKPEIGARMHAKQLARHRELGTVFAATQWSPTTQTAARIAAEVESEESLERDLVEQSLLEDSSLVNGIKVKKPLPMPQPDGIPEPAPGKPVKVAKKA